MERTGRRVGSVSYERANGSRVTIVKTLTESPRRRDSELMAAIPFGDAFRIVEFRSWEVA